jgi:hypothetical protein
MASIRHIDLPLQVFKLRQLFRYSRIPICQPVHEPVGLVGSCTDLVQIQGHNMAPVQLTSTELVFVKRGFR